MARAAFLIGLAVLAAPVAARDVVDASEPDKLAVTVYRDPARSEGDRMNTDWPRGFAMISETRRVTLPPGKSTIRFTGVAEGMVAVSAIVTGLPGGTIEKNRNAELLSPAALVNGMLGNRITITRTNPATGVASSEEAIVRTRADGGLVLQTSQGYEAVRCAGIPERLTFPSVPEGLSAKPVFTIDTRDETGGTYDITLSYLAWGFDWQAHYVATLDEGRDDDNKVSMRVLSWLTVLNDNGQSFADAELMAVAGKLNIVTDMQQLADPPVAAPLRLTCYPFGSTARGTPFAPPPPPPPPPPMAAYADAEAIVVTGARAKGAVMESAVAIQAVEEQLGDLKLYRVPERVSVNAQGLKQVAFLNKQDVQGEFLYVAYCDPGDMFDLIEDERDMETTGILLATRNVEGKGLGVALPMGGFTLYEPSETGPRLVGEETIRDYAVGQDVEIGLGESNQVFAECARTERIDPDDEGRPWVRMKLFLTNANPGSVRVRANLGGANDWEVKGVRGTRLKDGNRIFETTVSGNGRKEITFRMRRSG